MKKLFNQLMEFKKNRLGNYFKQFSPLNTVFNTVRASIVVLFIAALVIILFSLILKLVDDTNRTARNEQFSFEQKSLASLGHHLTDVSVKLAAIQQTLQDAPRNKPIDIAALRGSLAHIQTAIDTASQLQRRVLEKNIAADNEAVQSKLTRISRQLSSIEQNQHTVTHLPASDLPFTVLHIDMIQAEPVVTVRYAHTDFPLLVGDSLAGFNLASADFLHQTCVFQTKAHSHTADIKVAFGVVNEGKQNA